MLAIRRQHAWIVDGVVTTRDLTNESVVVEVAGPDQVIELALNISDDDGPAPGREVLLASPGCGESVPSHGWAVGVRPRRDDDPPYLVRKPDGSAQA